MLLSRRGALGVSVLSSKRAGTLGLTMLSSNKRAVSSWAKLKSTAKEMGVPFFVYWTGVWAATGVGCYGALAVSGFDAIAYVNEHFGLTLEAKKEWGTVGAAFAINEVLEVVRLPFCVLTFRPLHRRFKRKQ